LNFVFLMLEYPDISDDLECDDLSSRCVFWGKNLLRKAACITLFYQGSFRSALVVHVATSASHKNLEHLRGLV
jgi:hypothetical protein